jgi:hypothetical protein
MGANNSTIHARSSMDNENINKRVSVSGRRYSNDSLVLPESSYVNSKMG